MWRRLAPHDALRPWQNRAMVGRVSFKMGDSRWYRPLSGGAWHWWLAACVWAWWLLCKAGLGCHDDVKSDVMCKAWAGGC